MNFLFRYNKETKKHSVEASTESLAVSITRQLCSGLTETVESLSINTGETKQFETDLTRSGVFNVSLEDSVDTTNISYSTDLDILSAFAEQVKQIFCEQSSLCGNCRKLDESSMCNLLLSAFSKSQVLVRRTSLPISVYSNAVHEGLNCESVELLNCSIENEYITGDFTYNKKLIKRLIAYDYLIFYLALTDENNDFPLHYPVEEMLEIMNHEEILCCIEKDLDISVTSIVNQELPTITLNISVDNRPPGVVGDYTLEVNNSVASYTLTSGMFTTLTTPTYFDPEGDNPASVKILTLPAEGLLVYGNNSDPVSINQIFTIAEIDAGELRYKPNQFSTEASSTTFNFAVSDAGSNTFTPNV